jgi:predicted nucleic acid-binding protein
MTRLLIDSSVLVKWFHDEGETDVAESRAILAAHARDEVRTHVIDLASYEVGNVLVRALGWRATDAADQLDDLLDITGTPLSLTPRLLRDAAALAVEHSLSFYDAAWAATAAGLGISLVSSDRRLQHAGLAESPPDVVSRLRLSPV